MAKRQEPTERQEQVVFMARVEWALPESIAALIFAIPNGGLRDPRVAARLKAEGVKRGVPDICVAIPRGVYHGLWIEMKRIESGRTAERQIEMQNRLLDEGYCAVVCRGAEQAWIELQHYLAFTA